MMFFKAVFALYFATIAVAIPARRDDSAEDTEDFIIFGTSCENPWPLSTTLMIPKVVGPVT